jgi:hypothetical protein
VPARKGEENPSAKITEEDVYAIRRDTRGEKQIAFDYGLSQGQVNRIRRRVKWKHLKEENENDARSND